ncbi:MAG TPA: HD domain-containing protein [Longimicrobiales bacterium]|nr:HD domain-containing protein [Longimicrobiales bacterium]
MGVERSPGAASSSTPERFAQQLQFVVAIDKLKNVLRVSRLTDGSRAENSAEHSWHIAVMAMALHEHAPAGADPLHVVRLLLVHDIVEIDAGDTYCYDADGYVDKQAREHAAAIRLFGLLPDDLSSEFLALWEEFEGMQTPAALFANALDRLQPFILGRFRDDGDWRFRARTQEQILARMDPVRVAAPALWPFVTAIVDDAFASGRFGAPYPGEEPQA